MVMMTKPNRVDERALGQLIEESEDLHADVMGVVRSTLPDLADYAADRRRSYVPDDSPALVEFDQARQTLIHRLTLAIGGVFGAGAESSVFARSPSAADGDIWRDAATDRGLDLAAGLEVMPNVAFARIRE